MKSSQGNRTTFFLVTFPLHQTNPDIFAQKSPYVVLDNQKAQNPFYPSSARLNPHSQGFFCSQQAGPLSIFSSRAMLYQDNLFPRCGEVTMNSVFRKIIWFGVGVFCWSVLGTSLPAYCHNDTIISTGSGGTPPNSGVTEANSSPTKGAQPQAITQNHCRGSQAFMGPVVLITLASNGRSSVRVKAGKKGQQSLEIKVKTSGKTKRKKI